MNRSISFALVVVFCVSAASAQAAGPKGKFGIRKPVGVTKASGTNVGINKGIGNVTNPIVNTPPKVAPGFPYNPNGLPMGHGPVVFNPNGGHGPINGLPVPYKPQPTCGWHKCWDHGHCYDWMRFISMTCDDDCGYYVTDDCSYDVCPDIYNDVSADASSDMSTDTDE